MRSRPFRMGGRVLGRPKGLSASGKGRARPSTPCWRGCSGSGGRSCSRGWFTVSTGCPANRSSSGTELMPQSRSRESGTSRRGAYGWCGVHGRRLPGGAPGRRGVDRVFGVRGDYTLTLLDYLIARPGLAWTGCAITQRRVRGRWLCPHARYRRLVHHVRSGGAQRHQRDSGQLRRTRAGGAHRGITRVGRSGRAPDRSPLTRRWGL